MKCYFLPLGVISLALVSSLALADDKAANPTSAANTSSSANDSTQTTADTTLPPAEPNHNNAVSLFSGFYFGLSGGASRAMGTHKNVSANLAAPLTGGGATYPLNFSGGNLNKNSFLATLYAGYGYGLHIFYLSMEAFVNGANYQMQSYQARSINETVGGIATVLNANNTINAKFSPIQYGIDLRPGILLTHHTLLYGRIGMGAATLSFSSNVTAALNEVPTAQSATFSQTLSASKTQTDWRYGGGLEQRFGHWGIRGEYVYTDYGRIGTQGNTVSGVAFPALGAGNVTLATYSNVKLSDNAVSLGISYYFPS